LTNKKKERGVNEIFLNGNLIQFSMVDSDKVELSIGMLERPESIRNVLNVA